MSTARIARLTTFWSLLLAPAFGLVAAVALPALRSSRSAEIAAVAAHQQAFYVYGVCILLSSYLLVPAVFGIMHLLPDGRPAWAFLGGGLTQVGLLVAIGDAATELVYWQMGAPGASAAQMSALADRYENAAGASIDLHDRRPGRDRRGRHPRGGPDPGVGGSGLGRARPARQLRRQRRGASRWPANPC